MRIALFINRLHSGGAERVMTSLANAWAARGHEITLLTIANEPVFYPLATGVRVRALDLCGESGTTVNAVLLNARRIWGLRKQLLEANPDIFISFMHCCNVLAILANLRTGVPTIVCEHNDPSQCRVGRMWSTLRVLTYPLADAVTFLTENVLQRWRWLGNASVMPNPVVVEKTTTGILRNWPQAPRRILAVGRLTAQKGFDRLISAFAQISQAYPEWSLTILGEGADRPQLERRIRELDLENRVNMPGTVTNPFDWMAEADFLVMSSRYEGFPCVVGEAMACGLPVVSFDCDSGPRDIIRHGVDGLLVEPNDVDALAAAMARLMADDRQRESMARRAPEVLDRFSLSTVLHRWDRLFARVTA